VTVPLQLDLADFLEARFAEDEAVIYREEHECPCGSDPMLPTRTDCPARWASELAAKRRVVADYRRASEQSRPSRNPTLWAKNARFGLRIAAEHIARSYADHPDYKPEGWDR
jgi:hypothetical protein